MKIQIFKPQYLICSFSFFLTFNQSSCKIIKMLTQVDHPPQNLALFKKGMTLDEYLAQMQTIQTGIELQQDLYSTSQKDQPTQSKKIITYEIRQSQEDQYQESHEQRNNHEEQLMKNSHPLGHRQNRLSNKNILMNFPGTQVKASFSNSRGFRVRKQSNSPFNHYKKDSAGTSPSKNFAITLFNETWKGSKDTPVRMNGNPSSTLYGKFLKGVKQFDDHRNKNQSKQKYFQKKNHQQIQLILKYQKEAQQKYNRIHVSETVDMRVEGTTDRLHDRKILSLKGHK